MIPDDRSVAYRREIDGLRALAVLAVVAFHARIPGFGGGFVGVDIFFVLSGYLIGGIILRDAASNDFGFARFAERRIRRIFPALLAMLAVATAVAFILLPSDLRAFGASLTGSAAMSANLLFARGSGYFAMQADAMPLLHLWSLSVEMQLYALLPLMLLPARRLGPSAVHAVLIVAIAASFAYSVWATSAQPPAAFYLPMSRGWEFLAGTLLAAIEQRPGARQRGGDRAAFAGFILIASSLAFIDDDVPFPGVAAVPTVVGTLLLLIGTRTQASRVGRLLKWQPLATIGLISYSLYLWHWPMIVLGGYYVLDDAALSVVRIGMAALALPVAWLSWRYIEQPFMTRRRLPSPRALIAVAIVASGALMLAGAAIVGFEGYPARFSPIVQRMDDREGIQGFACIGAPIGQDLAGGACGIGDRSQKPSFLLWGDSHAAVYLSTLRPLARARGIGGYAITTAGCVPLLPAQVAAVGPDWSAECRARNRTAWTLLTTLRPKAVIIAARWSSYDGKTKRARKIETDLRTYVGDLARLRALGIRVYLVLDVPETGWRSPIDPAKAWVVGGGVRGTTSYATHRARSRMMRELATRLQARGLVTIIDPARALCDARMCRAMDGNGPLYFDGNHLNARGARLVAPAFEPAMRAVAAAARE